jgi:crotonobetainyl-CoA:carnitine CoA-transferase CaiB-like acyl-CoA transferase
MNTALPLANLVVVELGTSVAGPVGAQILAELGAQVIKIEAPVVGDDARHWGPPFVSGTAAVFNAINRNKLSAAVDLKDELQRTILRRFIIERVDVVLQNFRPGSVERSRLDAATLRESKPSLIYCNIGAYGTAGPQQSRPGYDPLMQAFGGIMGITGEEGHDPVRVGPPIVDQGAGMWAVVGILAALHRRALTGDGCEVGTSLYEAALGWMGMHAASFLVSGRAPKRLGSENAGIVPSKAFEVADGWLFIAAGNDNSFRLLADCLNHVEWADDPRFRTNPDRVRHRECLNGLIGEVVANDKGDVWKQKLDAAGVPCAPVLSLDQVMAEPQFAAVGMLQSAPDGSSSLLGLPLRFDGVRPPFRRPPPALGGDSAVISGS